MFVVLASEERKKWHVYWISSCSLIRNRLKKLGMNISSLQRKKLSQFFNSCASESLQLDPENHDKLMRMEVYIAPYVYTVLLVTSISHCVMYGTLVEARS